MSLSSFWGLGWWGSTVWNFVGCSGRGRKKLVKLTGFKNFCRNGNLSTNSGKAELWFQVLRRDYFLLLFKVKAGTLSLSSKMVFCFYFYMPLYWGHRRSQPYAEISHYLGRGSPKLYLLSSASQKTICVKVSCVSQTLGRKTDFGTPLSPRLPDLISCLASGRILFFFLSKFIYWGVQPLIHFIF